MASNPSKLTRFCQELKRRKVTRTITVYAAAAFVILELLSIVIEPLRLPNWTLQFAIVFLCMGFIIAVIFSWIYDIHPKGVIVKTEPADKIEANDVPKTSNSWKIASYISFLVIVGLIVLNIIPRIGKKQVLDKSIVVLPFNNLSSDQENTYFIDGVMESILDNLCKIEDLRIPGRTSVMQYRENPKPIPIVAEEMDVAYVLEGSGQKIGNRLLLTVQLIIGIEDRHIWSKQYDRVIEKVEDLIDIQKEIAELVASEIEVVITPKELDLIEKVPTTDLTAYDLYQQGRSEDGLDEAEALYLRALEYDSSYAQAYLGLAEVYWRKNYSSEYFSEGLLDSALKLINTAIFYDPMLSQAHAYKGMYFNRVGKTEQALYELNRAIELNPNDWFPYFTKAQQHVYNDLVATIENGYKAASLHRGESLPGIFKLLLSAFTSAGFPSMAQQMVERIFELTGDSLSYYFDLSFIERQSGNHQNEYQLLKMAYSVDPDDINTLIYLGDVCSYLGKHEESLGFIEKYLEKVQHQGGLSLWVTHRVGYCYWMNGMKDEALRYFNMQLDYSTQESQLGRTRSEESFTNYDIAATYAFLGEKEKALENLRIFNQREHMHLWMVTLMRKDPLLESLRNDAEFQQIVRDVETKYQAEHERVRQWLEENDML